MPRTPITPVTPVSPVSHRRWRPRAALVLASVAAGLSLGGLAPHAPSSPGTDIAADRFAAHGRVAQGVTVEAVWPVSPDEAFDLLTDADALREAFALEARIDLAIGGRYEFLFGTGVAPEGQQGSETCQILAYIPGETLAFSWNAPPAFEERAMHTWVVITLAPGNDTGTTALRLRHVGFGQGGRWSEVEHYFQTTWERLLGAMGEDLRQ
ncbi:MAG: SRPBCC domain-containing protein [Phycisphaerales bacterium]|nr:SRPBCC domain-containing protein [Phycisphaerales bacterium]